MKILITGSSGMLGRALREVLRARHELSCPSHSEMDVTDAKQVFAYVAQAQPDAIIHTAAISGPDVCQRDPDAAFRINTLGARNVALASGREAIPLVHVSTDYVFDGTKGEPYTEFDSVRPVNVYGHTKLAAEGLVKAHCRQHIIVRTGVLFAPWGKNPVVDTLEKARRGEQVSALVDHIGSPTYVVDLARAIERLLLDGIWGMYHVVNVGCGSRFELAQKVLRLAGLDEGRLNPTHLADQVRPAPRPPQTPLRNYILELEGRNVMRRLDDALAECINRILDVKRET